MTIEAKGRRALNQQKTVTVARWIIWLALVAAFAIGFVAGQEYLKRQLAQLFSNPFGSAGTANGGRIGHFAGKSLEFGERTYHRHQDNIGEAQDTVEWEVAKVILTDIGELTVAASPYVPSGIREGGVFYEQWGEGYVDEGIPHARIMIACKEVWIRFTQPPDIKNPQEIRPMFDWSIHPPITAGLSSKYRNDLHFLDDRKIIDGLASAMEFNLLLDWNGPPYQARYHWSLTGSAKAIRKSCEMFEDLERNIDPQLVTRRKWESRCGGGRGCITAVGAPCSVASSATERYVKPSGTTMLLFPTS